MRQSRTDASSTYRGYRNQALYVLTRMFTDTNVENLIYRPEGTEDLDIFDAQQKLIESIQVKDYSSGLALSHFKPASDVGFFVRFKLRRTRYPNCITRIASFGSLGPELDGAIAGDLSHRNKVVNKLLKKNSSISERDARAMLDALKGQVEHPNSVELHSKVLSALEGTIAGGHAESSLNLLMYWVFDASENQKDLTRIGLLQQLERIGEYLAALRDTSHEWGISVRPVNEISLTPSEKNRLTREYRQGVQALWEHIQADADSPRPEKLNEIHRHLQRHMAVIIRGASGQGKSSLGWRYLQEFCGEGLRFHIRLVEGREHALRVANALRSHVQRLQLQVVVYVDLSPSDTGWEELVRDLSTAGLKVILTIREEDFRRSGISTSDFDYGELVLEGVTRAEAKPIFDSLNEESKSTALDFEDAWTRFSSISEGPLLEFTYLITEGESLQSRIKSQVQRLQRDAAAEKNGITSSHLELLTLCAIANSADARVDYQMLCEASNFQPISNPLAVLENEYLVRVQGDTKSTSVGGLHSIRSRALRDAFLIDGPHQHQEYLTRCLPLVVDEDIEIYLLCAFSRHSEFSKAIQTGLKNIELRSWTQVGGITKALIWQGVSQYEKTNRATILNAMAEFGDGWQFVCDTLISMGSDAHKKSLAKFNNVLNSEIKSIELSPKKTIFKPFEEWTDSVAAPPSPSRSKDWANAGDVAYWIGHNQLKCELHTALLNILPDTVPDNTSIYDLASFISGYEQLGQSTFLDWHNKHKAEIIRQILIESNSVYVNDDGHEIKAFFNIQLFDDSHDADQQSLDLHAHAMKRVDLIRDLFPHRSVFGTQGLGLKAFSEIVSDDPTYKQIPVEQLPSKRSVQLNAMFTALVSFRLKRPDSWKTYSQAIFKFRNVTSECFRKLHRIWDKLLGEATPKQTTTKKFPIKELEQIDTLSKLPMYPKSVVDEWGFVSEGQKLALSCDNEPNENNRAAILRFEPWRKIFHSYESGVTTMCSKIESQINVYIAVRSGKSPNEDDEKEVHLLLVNLAAAWESLETMQQEFRQLFSRIFDSKEIEKLENYERINFRHLWAVTFAFCYERQQPVQNAAQRIEAEINRRRQRFLNSLSIEITNELTEGSSVEVIPQIWEFDGIPHLRIACNHPSACCISENKLKVLDAIWRASQNGGWRTMEWIPLTIEWPRIAVVHLVQGFALESSCVLLSTDALFGTESTFEAKVSHYIEQPVDTITFNSGGFSLWNSPLLRGTIELNNNLTKFVLTNLFFYEISEFVDEYTIFEPDLDFLIEQFSKDLTNVLFLARQSFTNLCLLLEIIDDPQIEEFKTKINELCSIRMYSIDYEQDININRASFENWFQKVESTTAEYTEVIERLMTFSIKLGTT